MLQAEIRAELQIQIIVPFTLFSPYYLIRNPCLSCFKDDMSETIIISLDDNSPKQLLTELWSALPGAASHWLGRNEKRPSLSAGARWEPVKTAQWEQSPLPHHVYRHLLCTPRTSRKAENKMWGTNRSHNQHKLMEYWLTVKSWLRSQQTDLLLAYCRRHSRRKT